MTKEPAVGRLVSIQIGRPKTYPDGPQGKPWRSAIEKKPIEGPARVDESGVDGDCQVDRRYHGGGEKAVLAYSADHYPRWHSELKWGEVAFGGFGENLTMTGLTEETVCIGDQFRIGTVTLELSQPRQPCWKVAKLRRQGDLVRRMVANGQAGWYFRVLKPGTIDVGQACCLVARPHPDWSVFRANALMYQRAESRAALMELMGLDALSSEWKKDLM